MDCYFHNAVPSVAVCHDCAKTICATCRDEAGLCPSCRLAQRIDAASAPQSGLGGGLGPSSPPPPPPPGSARAATATASAQPPGALAAVSPETRGLLALGYPFWPLAVVALLDPKRSPVVRRQATQAIALNFGFAALWFTLAAIAHIPVLGWSAWPLLPLLAPIWLVAVVVYGFKVWHGDEMRVPLVSDWLDERERERDTTVNA